MYDVINIGGASRDIFFRSSEGIVTKDLSKVHEKLVAFDYGSKIIVDEAVFSYGGGALNSAICMSKLGMKVAPLAVVGNDDNGKNIKYFLEKRGIEVSFLAMNEVQTALSFFVIVGSDHVGFLHRGANDHLKVKSWDFLKQTKWFYISSLTGDSASLLPSLIEFAQKNSIRVALNPGSVQLEEGYDKLKFLLEKVEILILNTDEAEELVMSREKEFNGRDGRMLLRKVYEMGPKKVIITDGERGSYYTDGDNYTFEGAYKTIAAESTGAGDAFGSTFVAMIEKGYSYQLAQKIASVNASSVVEKVGAQEGLLREDQIKRKLSKVVI